MNKDDKKLSYRIALGQERIPAEYFDRYIEGYDRQLAYELFKNIKPGGIYTVEVRQYKNPEDLTVSVIYGKVKPITYKPIYPKRLGFINRLKVLFTGNVPFHVGRE